jgi:alpha-1,2-mannosyltransferase
VALSNPDSRVADHSLERWVDDGGTGVRNRARCLLLLAAGTVGAFAAYWALARGSTPYDFRVYRNAGRAVLAGRSPYPALPLGPHPHGSGPFLYPLPAAWIHAPFALLPFSIAAWCYAAASIAAILLGAWWLGVRRPVTFALILGSSVAVRGLGLGTVDAFLFCGVCALVRFRERPRTTALVWVALIAIKPLMLPLIVYVVVTGRRPAAVTALAGTAAVVAGSVAAGFSPTDYARLLSEFSAREAVHGESVIRELVITAGWALGPTTALVSAAGFAVLLATLVAGLRGRLDHRVVLAIAVCIAVVVSPVVWWHYMLFLLVPLLLLPRQTLVAAIAFAVSWTVAPASLPHLHFPPSLSLSNERLLVTVMPLVVLAVVLAADRARPRAQPQGPGRSTARPPRSTVDARRRSASQALSRQLSMAARFAQCLC